MDDESLLIWVAVMPVFMLGVHLLIAFVQNKKKSTD